MNGAASRQLSNSVPPTLLATRMPIAPNRLNRPMTEPRMRAGRLLRDQHRASDDAAYFRHADEHATDDHCAAERIVDQPCAAVAQKRQQQRDVQRADAIDAVREQPPQRRAEQSRSLRDGDDEAGPAPRRRRGSCPVRPCRSWRATGRRKCRRWQGCRAPRTKRRRPEQCRCPWRRAAPCFACVNRLSRCSTRPFCLARPNHINTPVSSVSAKITQ